MSRLTTFILLIVWMGSTALNSAGQDVSFIFKGAVYGYFYDNDKGLLQKNQETELEGVLSDVEIVVNKDNQPIKTFFTNYKGEFSLHLEPNNVYTITFEKLGYKNESIVIDTKVKATLPVKGVMTYRNLEVLLNSYKPDKRHDHPIGRIWFDSESEHFNFTPNKERYTKKKLLGGEKMISDNAAELLSRTVVRNRQAKFEETTTPQENSSAWEPRSNDDNVKVVDDTMKSGGAISFDESAFALEYDDQFSELSADGIEARRTAIERARAALEEAKKNAKTDADRQLIAEWEEQIKMAERELETAQKFIESQESEIKSKNRAMLYMIGGLVLLVVLIGGLIYYLRERKRVNKILSRWKKDITESITYAQRIQNSFLLREKEIQEIIPKSFVLHMPRDIVSGDFFWIAREGKKRFIAAIDCTGHGVPGAFISSMGNTMLNQIVHEKGIHDPGKILSALHKSIFDALRQDKDSEQAQDGMDMSLVVLEDGSNTMKYAGAFNPIFVVRMNDVMTLKVDLQGVGGESLRPGMNDRKFTTHEFKLMEGDTVYQLSDGYMDQFGGENGEKFNVPRFRDLVAEIHMKTPLEQKSALKRAIVEWMGDNHKQLDDILIVAFQHD